MDDSSPAQPELVHLDDSFPELQRLKPRPADDLGPMEAEVVHLVVVPSIFSPRDREHRLVEPAATVGELVERECGPGPWHLIMHGRRVEEPEPLRGGEEVVAVRIPGDFVLPLIVFAITNAVIGVGIGLLINLLLGPKGRTNRPNTGAEGGSPTYNWDGISNTFTNGTPIPVIYGKHRVGGHVIGLYRRNITAASTDVNLHMLIALGFGPLNAIGQYKTDQDDLITSGSIEDDFNRPDENLSVDPRWTTITGSPLKFIIDLNEVLADGTNASVKIEDTLGMLPTNLGAQAKLVLGSIDNRIAINLLDHNNHHGIYVVGTTATVVKRVAGVDTTLGTFTIVLGDVLRIQRAGDTIEAFRAGVLQLTAAADTALTSPNVGFANISGPNQARFDDFEASGARGLPDGMHINGVGAGSFNNLTGSLRLGRYKQATMGADFDRVIQPYQPAIVISTDWLVYDMHQLVQGFHIIFDFPGGLYDQTAGFATATVTVEVQLSEDGNPFAAIAGSPFSFTHKLTSPFSRTVFHDVGLSGLNQKIRVRRQKKAAGDDNALIADKCVLADVNEIAKNDTQRYDDIAVIGLVIKATDQLQGGTPLITTLVDGVSVPIWGRSGIGDPADFAKEPLLSYAFSQNPAWIALDILLEKGRGLGNWIKPTDIDIEAFADWADWSDELTTYADEAQEPLVTIDSTEAVVAGTHTIIITDPADAALFVVNDYVRIQFEGVNQLLTKTPLGDGRTRFTLILPVQESYPAGWQLAKLTLGPTLTDIRHQFNGVFDGSVSSWDAFLRVCRVGRAMPVKLGSRISIRIEKEADPVQHINEANMVVDSFEIQYVGSGERVDIVEAQFLNAALDFDQDVEKAGGFPPSSIAKQPVRQSINLYGITNAREARREAFYHLLAQRRLEKKCTFNLPIDGIAAEQGDVISIGATMPAWSDWTGRATGTLQRFVLSHEVILDAGVSYAMMIRTPGAREPAIVTVTSPAATYPAGTEITTNAASDEQIKDALATIGRATKITTRWRILSMTIRADLTVEVQCVQYDDSIYAPQGWTLCQLPLGAACIDENCEFFLPMELCGACPKPIECDDGTFGPTCFCCFVGDIVVDVDGDGASCIEIIGVGIGGVRFKVGTGCKDLEFCITVTVAGEWQVLCDPCTCAGIDECPAISATILCDIAFCTKCYTICSL